MITHLEVPAPEGPAKPPALAQQGGVAPRWATPEKPARDRNLQTSPKSSILGFGRVKLHAAVLCCGNDVSAP